MNKAKLNNKTCIHCDYPLEISYKFCPNCSQNTEIKRLTISRFFKDFLTSTISYDSKGMRTVVSMLKKPGQAALTFINGDKISFVNPFRMYLYVFFLFFFLTNITQTIKEIFFEEGKTLSLSEVNQDKESSLQQKNNINLFGINFSKKGDSITIKQAKSFDKLTGYKRPLKIFDNFRNYRSLYPNRSKVECFAELGFKDNFWNNYLYKKSDFELLRDKDNVRSHLFNKLPILLFFNIPIISFLLLLVQFRQPFNFTENMILMFHYMTIVFFLMTFAELIDIALNTSTFTGLVFSLFMPIYFYKSLRNFYNQSRLKTILKFVILSGMFFVSLTFMLILNFVFLFLTF